MKEILLAFHGKTIERIMLLFVRRIKQIYQMGNWKDYGMNMIGIDFHSIVWMNLFYGIMIASS